MGRKRKVPIADEEKENEDESAPSCTTVSNSSMMLHGPMYTIMSNVQLNETFHKKYVKEMHQLYAKMDHDAFIFTFFKMIKSAMEAEEINDYANTTLLFCAKFVSSADSEDTHPLLVDTCVWLLTTISHNPHIRFRLCQFVNMILNALGHEAALDDAICDRIMEYMLERLRDVAPNVRVQAILAMQRLQVPDNPDDPVLRAYQFHLCSDPSPRVRQSVITCMGRNYHTIPYILDRLWDVDEKVRRHTYLHMSSYPVRSYKVSQRLSLLEQGLNDRSDAVRKVVTTIMLQQWIESYQKNLLSLVSALKLDSNEDELDRFQKITKQTLKEIFKRQDKADLVACVPLEEDSEFHRCVVHEKLTIEVCFYWQCLTEYLQTEMAEELDLIVPELSTFCSYIERFCKLQKPEMDKFEQMEFQYMLLSLMNMLYTFDLGDEIGRGNLKKLLSYLLKDCILNEKVIKVIVKCAENLITEQNERLQYFVEIVQDICDLSSKPNEALVHDRNLFNEWLANSADAALNLKLSSLKVKIWDLEEQETNFGLTKEYVKAHQIRELKNAANEEYAELLKPLLEKHASENVITLPLQLSKVVKNESILKGLQITFYMVVSDKVCSINPSICKLYNKFICLHMASNQIAIRDWALKCGTAFSMLYETLAKDVFDELYAQFFKNHNIRIWETAITCIFELLDRYGVDNFVVQEQQSKSSKKTGRQLYNTLEFLDIEDESGLASAGQGVGVIYMMSHFLDTCDETCIMRAIITGFCRLVLRGYIHNNDIIEKLLLRYFNPTTDPEINQILGVFLDNIIQRKKQNLLEPCLLPIITSVISATYDSPLHEIRPETITRFIIDATRQESNICGHIHNKFAKSFLQEMLHNVNNKELCKLLAKELITLEINVMQNLELKNEMKNIAENVIKSDFDPKTIKNVIDFKDMLDGVFNPTAKIIDENESDDDDEGAVKSTKDTTEQLNMNENDAIDQTVTDIVVASIEVTEINIETPTAIPESSSPSSVAAAQLAASSNKTTAKKKRSPTAAASKSGRKNTSPSAITPTTYGPDNQIGHRFLRKSLNASRGQSSDVEGDEGPSRPAKIRIEARIDSDKKSSQPEEENKRKSNATKSTRAKRNLTYAEIANGINSENDDEDANLQSEQSEDIAKSETNSESEAGKTTAKSKKTPHRKQARARLDRTPTGAGDADKVLQRTSTRKKTTRSAIHAAEIKNTPKHTAAERRNESVSDDATINELDVSDVIPPSPTAVSPRLTTSTLRSRATVRATALRSTRSQNRNQPTQSPRKDNNEVVPRRRSKSPKAADSTLASTPLRNGRKRILTTSPKAFSPLRKQLRQSNNAAKSPEVINSVSGKKDNDSPSSTKENEIAVSNQISEQTTSSANSSDDDAVTTTQSKRSTRQDAVTTQIPVKKAAESRIQTLHVSATKRSSPRLNSLPKTIPRILRRMSAENRSNSASSIRSNASTTSAIQSKGKAPSKIPIRTSVLSKKASTISISGSTSSGSSTEEVVPSLLQGSKFPRRKALTTKMTRINLSLNQTGPVPMRIARPTRADVNREVSSNSKFAKLTRNRPN